MSKTNILYLENFSDISGGGQVSLLGLLEKLDKGLFNPIVICPSDGSLVEALMGLGIEVRIVAMPSPKSLRLPSFIKSILEIKRIIIDKGAGLIHANGSRACLYAGIVAKLMGIPLIWHVRIADRDYLLDRILSGLSVKIIAISEAVGRRFSWLKDWNGKVRVIYNGIDFAKFSPDLSPQKIKNEFAISSQALLVGSVGRLDWYKGYRYLLGAARKVVDNIPDCHFLIVGEGEERKELEGLAARLKLGGNVIFAGKRQDIPEILAALDLFVLSSVSEGLGRAIIEAMAMGKAVVAANTGGIPEVVLNGQTGILVPEKDESALAEAIIELLRNRKKAVDMGMAGRERALAKFDLNTNVEKTQALYRELIDGGKGRV